MPRKRTLLDREISRLEKNARNKVYRLERRGATNARAYSPMFDDSGERVNPRAMNGAQKLAYARRLQAFNSRDNAFMVADSGQALSKREYNRYLQLADKLTQQRRKAEERLAEQARRTENRLRTRAERALAEEERRRAWYEKHGTYRGREYKMKSESRSAIEAWQDFQAQQVGGRETLRVFDAVTPNVVPETPEQLRQLIGALQSSIEKLRTRHSPARDKDWKRGIAARLEEHGYAEVADEWNGLTRSQREWLHYYTDFSTLASQFRYETQYARGETRMPADVFDDAASQMMELIRIAKAAR